MNSHQTTQKFGCRVKFDLVSRKDRGLVMVFTELVETTAFWPQFQNFRLCITLSPWQIIVSFQILAV